MSPRPPQLSVSEIDPVPLRPDGAPQRSWVDDRTLADWLSGKLDRPEDDEGTGEETLQVER